MNIGNLDKLITIEYDTGNTKNEGGEPVPDWQTYCQAWAKIESKSGSEAYEAEQLVGTIVKEFTIHYQSGITQKMRVSYNSEYYDISYIAELGREQYLVITAEKKDN